jgi:hypothetical protein
MTMRDRLVTLGTLALAAGAYYLAHAMGAGAARDGVLMVAGALVTLQAQPIGRKRIKAAAVAGIVLLAGCGAALPIAQSALQALAPIAAEALRRAAADRGVELDEGQALCEPMPEEHTPDGMVLVVCVAPEVGE